MSTWTPDIPVSEMMLTLVMQGFAMGLVFNPLSVMAYTTLTPQLRGEGPRCSRCRATSARRSACR